MSESAESVYADLDEAQISALIDGLVAHGWVMLTDFFPRELTGQLYQDVQGLGADALVPARVGRDQQLSSRAVIRRDKTRWLEADHGVQRDFLLVMDRVRVALNQALFLGVQEYEAHYARYDVGDFYKTHVDALQGERNRVVSSVLYLNPQWLPGWGGELVLYGDEQRELVRVMPEQGTAVFFLSERFPHEVLPASQARYSIAGWFRVRSDRVV